MVTKYFTIGLLITATLFILGSGCGKDKNSSKPCSGGDRYNFNVESQISPQKEVYNTGDTILITSNIPTILLDLISNEQIRYSNNLGIGGNIGIGLIDSINRKFELAADSFNILSSKGSFSLNKVVNILFNESSIIFQFEIKLIPKKKGNYILGISDLGSQGIINKDCTNAGFTMFVNNSNKHFAILTNANILGVTIDAPRIATNYCFRVQ